MLEILIWLTSPVTPIAASVHLADPASMIMLALGTAGAAAGGAFQKMPKVPTRDDAAEARRRAIEQAQQRRGRATSFLTGPQGATGPATLGRHSLLGGGGGEG